jgi:hypothetical protein
MSYYDNIKCNFCGKSFDDAENEGVANYFTASEKTQDKLYELYPENYEKINYKNIVTNAVTRFGCGPCIEKAFERSLFSRFIDLYLSI